MNFVLLLLSGAIASLSGLSIRSFQLYIQKHPLQMQFYQVLSMGIGAIVYLILSGFTFPATLPAWLLALAFSVCLAVSSIGYAEAMHNGPSYAAAVEARAERAAAEADNTKKAVKKINSNIEKTTLGDLDALAALKSQLENK